MIVSDLNTIYRYLNNIRLELPVALRTFSGNGGVLTPFINALRNRITLCGSGALSAAADRQWLTSSLFARANMEACALFISFSEDVNPTKPDSSTLKRAEKYLFSTRTFAAGQGVHINDCLRIMFKKDDGLQATYDVLCEAVHPNWLGVLKMDVTAGDKIEAHVKEIILQSLAVCGRLVAEAIELHYEAIPNLSSGDDG